MMQSVFENAAVGIIRLVSFFLRRMPAGAAVRFGGVAGRVAYVFSDRRRRVAYADLKAAFGERYTERERWRMVRHLYRHLGQMTAEVVRFPILDREAINRHIRLHGIERFYGVIKENKGVVLMTAHFGNWELLQIVSGIIGKPVHVLGRSQKYSRLDEMLNQMRESHGSVAIQRGMGIRSLFRALYRGDLVGVLGDQDAQRDQGLILPFLGRKTTVPTGGFELAARTGAPVLPCFIVRGRGCTHDIYVCEPIRFSGTGTWKSDMEAPVSAYVKLLEDFIFQHPSQWLWGTKRWKFSWTKRLLILSDGKPGHVKQSEAVAACFRGIDTQYGRPGMEYPTKVVTVHYRSLWRKRLFPWFAFFFIPFAQGRLRGLRFFFSSDTRREIESASADFVISAGAALVPLNLCIARDSRAKSVVLMKPGFPYNFFRFALAIVPRHDRGLVPRGAFRPVLTPNLFDPERLALAAEKLKVGLRDPSRIKVAVFLGGATRRFRMALAAVEKVFFLLDRLAQTQGDFLVTTSRRTPPAVCDFLKKEILRLKSCQMLVIASKDSRPEVVPGMMELAGVLIVTEDSISMISEAVSSGKKVIILSFGDGLGAKHRRFKKILTDNTGVFTATPDTLEEVLRDAGCRPPSALAKTEKEALMKRLAEIL